MEAPRGTIRIEYIGKPPARGVCLGRAFSFCFVGADFHRAMLTFVEKHCIMNKICFPYSQSYKMRYRI